LKKSIKVFIFPAMASMDGNMNTLCGYYEQGAFILHQAVKTKLFILP